MPEELSPREGIREHIKAIINETMNSEKFTGLDDFEDELGVYADDLIDGLGINATSAIDQGGFVVFSGAYKRSGQ